MAFVDVGMETCLDPMLSDAFTVTRRPEVMTSKGRSSVPAPVVYTRSRRRGLPPPVGVVTVASPNDLERLDDQDRAGRNISIVTRFPLQMTASYGGVKYKPDQIYWRGDTFIVKSVDPYPQFGAGFVQAIAGSIDHQDAAT